MNIKERIEKPYDESISIGIDAKKDENVLAIMLNFSDGKCEIIHHEVFENVAYINIKIEDIKKAISTHQASEKTLKLLKKENKQ